VIREIQEVVLMPVLTFSECLIHFELYTILRKQNRMSAFRSKIQLKRECGMVKIFPHTILKNEKQGRFP
jgi:hypothetical protein